MGIFRNNPTEQFVKVGRTETIKDNLNPNFTQSFVVDFVFEQKQDCRFELYDDDGSSADFLGSCETTIGKIMVKDGIFTRML
jgi:Ca2+-dependent lipid-binding protein